VNENGYPATITHRTITSKEVVARKRWALGLSIEASFLQAGNLDLMLMEKVVNLS
jgi:hypothetical protein